MITFGDVFATTSWEEVSEAMFKVFPDQEEMLGSYKTVFETVKTMAAERYEMVIVFSRIESMFDGEVEKSVEVSGIKPVENDTERYALEFLEWRKWLGMWVATETVEQFSAAEVVAYCLNEMTFMGFKEEEIQGKFQELKDRVDDMKTWTEEERRENTISHEEVLRRLRDMNAP